MDIEPEISNSKNRTSVIDVIAHDPKTGEAVLVMNEPNEWDSSDEQLLSLQERFNAYVSFLLDGEMESGHPELAGKPARIEVRCRHMPDSRALELLGLIHDQLAFQDIKLEVVVRNEAAGLLRPPCGSGGLEPCKHRHPERSEAQSKDPAE